MPSVPLSLRPPAPARGSRCTALAFAVALHVALIVAIAQYAPARRSLARVAPIVVSLVLPPPVELPPPPPKPPVAQRTPPKAPTATVVGTPVEPARIVSDAPAVSPVTVPPPAAQPPAPPVEHIVAPPTPPTPVEPPRFDADYLDNPAPAYPPLARRMKEQGRVLVRVLVSVGGMPERIEIKTSSGSARLDQAALDTVRIWKFVPARQGDKNVAAWVVVPITFSLDA